MKTKINKEQIAFKAELKEFPGGLKVYTDHLFNEKKLESQTMELIENGTINFMSARDISKKYGRTHQYWSKVMKQEKIKSYQTGAGRITFDIYVEYFLEKRKIKE